MRYLTHEAKRKKPHTGRLLIYRIGRFGEEVDVEYNSKKFRGRYRLNRHVCRMMPITRPEGALVGRPLHPNHGYLEKSGPPLREGVPAQRGRPGYVKFFKNGQAEPFILPLEKIDVENCIDFYSFKGAYFLHRCGGNIKAWKVEGCQNVGWLYPDGRSEVACLPKGPWLELQVFFVIPTARGYLFSGVDTRRKARIPGAVYLLTERGVQLVETGYVDGSGKDIQVSQDGCRVAYGFAKSPKFHEDIQEGAYAVHVLDVCNRD